jgi:ATP-dependent DNA helicase RecG
MERVSPGLSLEKTLQLLDLAEFLRGTLRLRRAAPLLFAPQVQKWHPRCEIRIFQVDGLEVETGPAYNVTDDETIVRPILELIPAAWDALRPRLTRTVYNRGTFSSRIAYPEDACFEAVVNAVAHRDYSDEGRPIEIYLFDDRLQVTSPGGLLSNVKLEALRELRGVHQSRNPFITRVMREAGLMREMGEGIRRMYQLFRESELIDPELVASSDSFSVILHHRSVYSENARRWLRAFDSFNLTKQERVVVLLGSGGELFSARDIMEATGISDTEDYRKVVYGLQLKGLIEAKLTKRQIEGRRRKYSNDRRRVPRFSIRDPKSAELYVSELTAVVRRLKSGTVVDLGVQTRVRNSLSSDSPFRSVEQIVGVLRVFNLVDEDRKVTV